MVSGLVLFSIGALIVGQNQADMLRRLSALLWGLVGGLLAYIYGLLQLPGSAWLLDLGAWAGLAATLMGALVGWLLFQLVHQVRQPEQA